MEEETHISKDFTPVRDVYLCSSFKDCLKDFEKEKSGLFSDFNKKLDSVIHSLITYKDLGTYLDKMLLETSPGTKHKICRIRLTVGGRSDNGIARVYLCSIRNICAPDAMDLYKFNREDLLLLYFTYDSDGHDKVREIYSVLDRELPRITLDEIERVKDPQIIKNNIIYRYVRNSHDQLNPVPLLSPTQKLYLRTCCVEPPCVVHGSAGSGKTLMSEELYAYNSEKSNRCLYVTYMDQLKVQVSNELQNMRNIHGTVCKTIDDLIRDYLGDDVFLKSYKTEEYFRTWIEKDPDLNRQCNSWQKKSLEDLLRKINPDPELSISITYIFYRTFSTESGYHSFNDNPNRKKLDDEAYFLKSCEYENGLSDASKKCVFFLCQMYERHLKENDFINDNEAARLIELQGHHEYDSIIVDEVQDLTEAEIRFLISLLKEGSKNFFVFGDDNQSINPTMMDISDVRTRIFEIMNTKVWFEADDLRPLDTSFRNTRYIINYINYINKVRKRSIGTSKSYNEKEQKSALGSTENNESDYPAILLDHDVPGLAETCLGQEDKVTLNDVMIITANKQTKEELIRRYPILEKDGAENVCTIEETKGREWSLVILYNFFSSAKSVWEGITKKIDSSPDLEGRGLRSSIYRMYFNRYYVGLTRAKNKVIVIETDNLAGKIRDTYFPADASRENVALEQLKDVAKFNAYFKNDHSHDVWDADAADSFNRNDYAEAYQRQTKAIRALDAIRKSLSNEDYEALSKRYRISQRKYVLYHNISRKEPLSPESVPEYLAVFIADRNMEFLKATYQAIKQTQRVQLLEMDPIREPDRYLGLYKQQSKTGFLSNEEKVLYYNNAVLAYKQKINSHMKKV